jgi:radical SAM protein with 4Fe4S-binding SPASM domain
VVCLIDPVGDVYACPFAIHDNFLAGNVRGPGGFAAVWQQAPLFAELRQPQGGGACTSCSAYDSCRGGCMAAKFFTGLPLDGPDPECVKGHGAQAMLALAGAPAPRPTGDHSHRTAPAPRDRRRAPVPVSIGPPPRSMAGVTRAPDRACDEDPLAGFRLDAPLRP